MTKREANKLFTKDVVNLDIFNSEIIVFFTRVDFNKAMVCRGHEELTGGGGATHHSVLINVDDNDEDHCVFIGIFDDSLNVIVHEATHAALFISDMIGHNVTKYDEIVPYLTAHIVTEILKLKEKNK